MIQRTIDIKPLSVNKCFQGRRFRTKDYLSYEKELSLKLGKLEKIKGYITVVIELYLVNDKRTDIDNVLKPLLDILTKKGAWEDDRKIRELHIYKYPSKKDRLNIVIEKI